MRGANADASAMTSITRSGVVLRGEKGAVVRLTGNPHRFLEIRGAGAWRGAERIRTTDYLNGLYYALLEGRFVFDFVHQENLWFFWKFNNFFHSGLYDLRQVMHGNFLRRQAFDSRNGNNIVFSVFHGNGRTVFYFKLFCLGFN